MPIIDNELIGNDTAVEDDSDTVFELLEKIIRDNIKQDGDALWMRDVSTGRSLSYNELLETTQRVSSALIKRGLHPNDSIMIMCSNFIELPLMMMAAWKAGASAANLTLNLFSSNVAERAAIVKPKFFLTDELRAERVLQGVSSLEYVKEVFVIGKFDGCTSFSELLEDDGTAIGESVNVDPHSMAWLMFSSGTTGIPKGIVHTHRTISAALINYNFLDILHNRNLMFVNLMVNSGGMMLTLLGTVSHASMSTFSNQSEANLLAAIDRIKPQVISAFPPHIAAICKLPSLDMFDLSSVQILLTGGSGQNPTYERKIFDLMPNMIALDVFYGMSEVHFVSTSVIDASELINIDKQAAIKRHIIGCSGKLFPSCRLKIIDPATGQKLGANEQGEVCVKTPTMLKEYLNHPEETANAIRDGWFHTGDKGYYDANENIFIVGRYKELIKYRMAHVIPTTIEQQIMTHPAVKDVGVIGQPHDEDYERPLAFVVVKEGHSVTAEEIIQHTKERVIDEEQLRGGVRFIDIIPRNELGKIVRPTLVKLL